MTKAAYEGFLTPKRIVEGQAGSNSLPMVIEPVGTQGTCKHRLDAPKSSSHPPSAATTAPVVVSSGESKLSPSSYSQPQHNQFGKCARHPRGYFAGVRTTSAVRAPKVALAAGALLAKADANAGGDQQVILLHAQQGVGGEPVADGRLPA